MTKQKIADIYRFLSVASMKRMNDDEKVAFMRLLRTMKPVFTELNDAVKDAVDKAKAEMEDESHIMEFVNKAVEDLATQEADIIITTMTKEAFDRLCLSNDWNFAQIDELEDSLVKPSQEGNDVKE